jgi:hypothetical protein
MSTNQMRMGDGRIRRLFRLLRERGIESKMQSYSIAQPSWKKPKHDSLSQGTISESVARVRSDCHSLCFTIQHDESRCEIDGEWKKGLNFVVIDGRTGGIVDTASFGTYSNKDEVEAMAQFIQSVGRNNFVLIGSLGCFTGGNTAAQQQATKSLREGPGAVALRSLGLGSKELSTFAYGRNFAMAGSKTNGRSPQKVVAGSKAQACCRLPFGDGEDESCTTALYLKPRAGAAGASSSAGAAGASSSLRDIFSIRSIVQAKADYAQIKRVAEALVQAFV